MINATLLPLPATSNAEHAAADAPAFPSPASVADATHDEAPFARTMRQKLMAQDRRGPAIGPAPAQEKGTSGVSQSRRTLPGVKSSAAKAPVKVSDPAPARPCDTKTKTDDLAPLLASDAKPDEETKASEVNQEEKPSTLPPPTVDLVAGLPVLLPVALPVPVSASQDVSLTELPPVTPLITNAGLGSNGEIFTRAELARQQADATPSLTVQTPTDRVTPDLSFPTAAIGALPSAALSEAPVSFAATGQPVVAAAPAADKSADTKVESMIRDAFVPSEDTGVETKEMISPAPASLRPSAAGLHGTSAAKNGDAMSRSDELAVRQEAGPPITVEAAMSFGSRQGGFSGQSRSEGELHSARPGWSGESVTSAMAAASAPAQTEPMTGDAPVVAVAAPVRSQEILVQVSRHAVELKQWNLTSMSVVLRPDANTELFLQLNQREGGIEVQARVERGDAAGLNAEWGALQRSLATQGVRLGALENDRATGVGDLRSSSGSGNLSAANARGMANGREPDAARLGLAATDVSSRTAAEFGSTMNQFNDPPGRPFGSLEHSRGEPGEDAFRAATAFQQQQRNPREMSFEDLVPTPGRPVMQTPVRGGASVGGR